MRNRLFDSIIQTSGADTDDIHSGEAEGNFWIENELFESVLREAHLQEMGYTPIQQAANSLRRFINSLMTPAGKSKDAKINQSNKADPDVIAKTAVTQLIEMGSGNPDEDETKRLGFIPVEKSGNITRMDKTTWIDRVLQLLSDISSDIIECLRKWLDSLIP